MIEFVRQLAPRGCGQACVAMILGVTFEEAVRLVGHAGPTRTRDLVAVLRSRGVTCEDRLRRWRAPPPASGLYLAHVCWYADGRRSGGGHWVVLEHGAVLDPNDDLRAIATQGCVTSGLAVDRR